MKLPILVLFLGLCGSNLVLGSFFGRCCTTGLSVFEGFTKGIKDVTNVVIDAMDSAIDTTIGFINGPCDEEKPSTEEKPDKNDSEAESPDTDSSKEPAGNKQPSDDEPVAEKPDAEKPNAEKPDAEKPDAEKPDAEKPADGDASDDGDVAPNDEGSSQPMRKKTDDKTGKK